MESEYIVHICHREDWEAALELGEYRPPGLEQEGFIHCSRPRQVLAVANRYFRGALDLVLLWIDPSLVRPLIRWEAAEGDLFPHIYGALNLEAVVRAQAFPPSKTGRFSKLPASS